MRAVTFQAPGEVRIEEKPDPELEGQGGAIVRVEATGICGSDLHIYHGRVQIDPGFTIGHEFVGTIVAVGMRSGGSRRVTACSAAIAPRAASVSCRRGDFHKCDNGGVFSGHGELLGLLQGAQAELLPVPTAELTLRKVFAALGRRRPVRGGRDGDWLPRR